MKGRPAISDASWRVVLRTFAFFGGLSAAMWMVGCTPEIGDKCVLSTDCSLKNDRICDTSEPNGYCTIESCTADQCPEGSACIEFNAALQGCPYNDRVPSRTSRSYCLKECEGSCRDDGYVCADPRLPPWNAILLDTDQAERVCVVAPDQSVGSNEVGVDSDAAVCAASGPSVPGIDASTNEIDGGESEAGAEDAPEETLMSMMDAAPIDASFDAPDSVGDATLMDAAVDASSVDASLDAAIDASLDAAIDGGTDAGADAGMDAGALDAGDAGG